MTDNEKRKLEIGEPRLIRRMRTRIVELCRRIDETQYQVSMLVPTESRNFESEFKRLFEDRIAATIRNVHLETVQLEVAGKISGFTLSKCVGE